GGALGPPERLVQPRQAVEHPQGVAQRGRRRPRGDRAARDVGGDGGAGGEADRFGVNHLSEEQEGSTLFRGAGAGGRDPADGVVGGGRGAVRAAGGGVRVVAPGSGGVFGAVGEVPQARAIGRRLTRKQRQRNSASIARPRPSSVTKNGRFSTSYDRSGGIPIARYRLACRCGIVTGSRTVGNGGSAEVSPETKPALTP